MPGRPTNQPRFVYTGFQSPNFTQVPDDLFDVLLPELSDPELRVLLYIIRRTYGFKKESDEISLRQMVDGITTRDGRVLDRGVGVSKASVARALQGLQAKGIVIATRNRSTARGNEPTTYALRFRAAPCLTTETRGGVSAVRQALVSPADPQYTDKQHTVLSSKANRLKKREIGHGGAPSVVGNLLRSRYAQAVTPIKTSVKQAGKITAEQGSVPRPLRGASRRVSVGSLVIHQAVEEISDELHDQQHVRSNITRALRLQVRSGLAKAAFVGTLYEARSITRDRLRSPSRGRRVTRAMPYLFAVLKDLLKLSGDGESGEVSDSAA